VPLFLQDGKVTELTRQLAQQINDGTVKL